MIDKSTWGRGPWQDEPDLLDWVDEKTGLSCSIVRTGMGHLCGYVGVPKTYSTYGKGYDDVSVSCHGGLTFAAMAEETGLWYFGFDCAHSGDRSPGVAYASYGSYKDFAYVRQEVEELAEQLFNMLESLAAVPVE